MGLPKGRESYGDGVLIVVAGVTPRRGERESRSQGEGEQVVRWEGSLGTQDAESRDDSEHRE